MAAIQFRTELQLLGKTATGIAVPDEVIGELGAGKRPPVRVTINDRFAYRGSIQPMDGINLLMLNAENRAAAGVSAGQTIHVAIELDREPRVVVLPPDFEQALSADRVAHRRFAGLSYSRQRERLQALESAKTDATRQRRIEQLVAALHEEPAKAP